MSNCNCRKDLEAKLTERFNQQQPQARDHKVVLQGYAICFGETLTFRSFMPYKATATYPLKKGGEKEKNEVGNMFFAFCPFCGEKESS